MSVSLDDDVASLMTPQELAAIGDDAPSPDELAAMQRIADGAANDKVDEDDGDDGGDVAGDGAGDDPASSAAPVEGAAAAATDDAGPAVEGDAQAPKPAAQPISYEATLPADYEDQVKEVDAKIADLKNRFRAGEIDFEELDSQRDELNARREALQTARVKAEISKEMSEQSAQALWRSTVDGFVAAAANEEGGIDYRKDLAKQADLDGFVKMLAARDENADKSMDWFLKEAHRAVKALHGVASAPVKAAAADRATALKTAAAARKPAMTNPATLAQVPGGDGPGDVESEFADVDALTGLEYEAAIARMTPAQRAKWLTGR